MHIQTKNYGENQVIISSEDLERLLEIARKVASVEVEEADFDNRDLMRLAETGGALDFLRDEREDICTAEDLKVKCESRVETKKQTSKSEFAVTMNQ